MNYMTGNSYDEIDSIGHRRYMTEISEILPIRR